MPKPLKSGKPERRSEAPLTKVILAYLAEHPQASDTLEGITEWWLMREQVRVEVSKLKRTLRHLMAQGLLEKVGAGEQSRYRLRAESDRPPTNGKTRKKR